jgi:hypothetical protein
LSKLLGPECHTVFLFQLFEAFHFGFSGDQGLLPTLELLEQFTTRPVQGLELGLELQVVPSLREQSVNRNPTGQSLVIAVAKRYAFALNFFDLRFDAANRFANLTYRGPGLITLAATQLQECGKAILESHDASLGLSFR